MTRARTLADLGSASLATDAEATAAASAAAAAVPTGAKNLLYNGAMQVAQRGTSTASITTAGYYTADRWRVDIGTLGTWTQSVEADGPTGSGFTKSLKMLCTTADAAPSAGDYLLFEQKLEGVDVQRVAKGTASARQLTLSFWVKANATGAYVVFLQDYDNNRSISAAYTIGASATWEKKVITFPVDTTGAFDNDNAGSLGVRFVLGAGSNWTSGTLATTWGALVLANLAPGQTNLAAATNNYWQVTGVQLEVGDTATEFEHLPFGVELARCQRYFQYGAQLTAITSGATTCNAWGHLLSEMRTTPTVSATGPLNLQGDNNLTNVTQSSTSVGAGIFASPISVYLTAIGNFSGLVAGRVNTISVPANNSNYFTFSSEL